MSLYRSYLAACQFIHTCYPQITVWVSAAPGVKLFSLMMWSGVCKIPNTHTFPLPVSYFLNAWYFMLEESFSKIVWTLAYSTVSMHSRMSLTGNNCLAEFTVIGSLNASEKPFKKRFLFCAAAKKEEFTDWNTHIPTASAAALHWIIMNTDNNNNRKTQPCLCLMTNLHKWTQTWVKLKLCLMSASKLF